ncbi:MAG: peptidyl-prolyl cis-trans isomerase [Acidobacteria bacterium]|nr:peptidyl-prolyl cis-trans isomerase [Acidobacteriota bacterium]
MFDMFRSRDKAVRTTLTVMLGLVALSMVAYLIPGGPGSASMGPEPVIAEVCDSKVTLREVQLQLQSALKNKSFPIQMIQNYIPEFVNQFVAERATACQASDMGIVVSEADVANAIKSMLPQIFQGGFNKELYAGFLAQQNLTIPEFEANVRKQMQVVKLRNLIMEGIIVTADEIEAEYRRRTEKIKIDYVTFSPEKFKGQVNLTPAEIQTYFNANRGLYKAPEKRSFDLLVASEEKIGSTINVTDAVLRQIYASAGDRFRSGERVRVRHILLKTTEKSADDVKKIEAKANDLLKQVKGGADFAKLAGENSEDPGSKDKGGEYGWMVKGQTVANFETAAFSLKKGEISNLVKTEYGFHIIQVLDREEPKVKAFEEVKDELATELRRQQVQARMEAAAEQARAELTKNPKNASAIAAKYNLNHYSVQEARPNDPVQEIGINQDFASAIFGLQPGGVTNAIVVNNKLVIGVLNGITPARPAELNEVESAIRAQLTEQKSFELMAAKQKEIEALVKSGADLKKIAQTVGGEVKTSTEFTHDGAAEGVGSGTYFADLFGKEPGAMTGPVNISGQVVVARLNAKTGADMSKLAEDRTNLITGIKGRKAQERKDLFEDGLVARMIDKGKIKLNQDVIRRLIDSYRG